MLKSLLLIYITVLALALPAAVLGQAVDDIRHIDEFDPRIGCETLERGLDTLLAEAATEAGSTAYVVIHQGGNVYDNAVVYRRAIVYPRFRGFPAERYTVLLTRGGSNIKVDLWISSNGKIPPVVTSDLTIKLAENVSRTQFSEDTLELVTVDDRETYIGTGNPSCLYGFSPFLISELLKANEAFDAELLIKTRSRKNYRKLVEALKADFHETGIPVERIKFVYGGRDKELEESRSKLASVGTSFVKRPQK